MTNRIKIVSEYFEISASVILIVTSLAIISEATAAGFVSVKEIPATRMSVQKYYPFNNIDYQTLSNNSNSSSNTSQISNNYNSTNENCSISTNSTTSHPSMTYFAFVYDRFGGFAYADRKITYDSFTKQLNIITDTGRNTTSKTLTCAQEQELIKKFIDNGFFQIDSHYLYEGSGQDIKYYTLIANMQSKTNAVFWSQMSTIPIGLQNVSNELESLSK